MGLKSKRRRAQITHKQTKKFRQSKKNISEIEPRNLVSDSESDNDSDDYFKEKDEFENDVEEILPITNEESDSDDEEEDEEEDDDEVGNENDYDIEKRKDISDQESSASGDEGPIEAWGKRRKTFFSTDFVDEDRGKSYREEDLENAKAEEADALAIHKNFLNDVYSSMPHITLENEFVTVNEVMTDDLALARPDWKAIDKKDKLHLIHKQNPEFLPTVRCFKEKLSELKNRIFPLLRFLKTVDTSVAEPYIDYINLKSQLLLHYCMNASFYMTLRSRNIPSSRHPVVKRLNDFKQLLDKFQTLDAALNPRIDKILKSIEEQSNVTQMLFSQIFGRKESAEESEELLQNGTSVSASIKPTVEKSKAKKKVHFDIETEKEVLDNYMKNKKQYQKIEESEPSSEEEAFDNEDSSKQGEHDENSKRTVSYEIAKNKGLTPHRKKEYRNPRVRHRMKFKRAQIRRKGQVRLPRKELQKYGGEASGISSHVSKSVKIK